MYTDVFCDQRSGGGGLWGNVFSLKSTVLADDIWESLKTCFLNKANFACNFSFSIPSSLCMVSSPASFSLKNESRFVRFVFVKKSVNLKINVKISFDKELTKKDKDDVHLLVYKEEFLGETEHLGLYGFDFVESIQNFIPKKYRNARLLEGRRILDKEVLKWQERQIEKEIKIRRLMSRVSKIDNDKVSFIEEKKGEKEDSPFSYRIFFSSGNDEKPFFCTDWMNKIACDLCFLDADYVNCTDIAKFKRLLIEYNIPIAKKELKSLYSEKQYIKNIENGLADFFQEFFGEMEKSAIIIKHMGKNMCILTRDDFGAENLDYKTFRNVIMSKSPFDSDEFNKKLEKSVMNFWRLKVLRKVLTKAVWICILNQKGLTQKKFV